MRTTFKNHRLYAIADEAAARAAGLTLDDVARALLAGGARVVQIRSKEQGSRDLLRVIDGAVARARVTGAEIVVNDRVDLMMVAGASGVHVGQTDLPPAVVRALVGSHRIVGFSTHTREQIDRASRLPITYLAVGPVFSTETKDTGYSPVGLDLVRYARQRFDGPIVAIGGISLDRAAAVLDAGADSVAVISDLLVSGSPAARVGEYLSLLGTARPG